jgi:lipoate-protein ligase A
MAAWRVLKLETYDASTNMAIDEAVLRSRIMNLVPNTLRFYRWNPSAVSIGRFQEMETEVQLENCHKCDIDIVRRITGGGTVYHSAEDEITYSAIVCKTDLEAQDITDVYAKIYSGLVKALEILGVATDFNEGSAQACPNLTVKGGKISGSAQAHKGGVVLQHGTLLLDVDLLRMFSFLRVPWAKTCMEVVEVAKSRITSLNAELERKVSIEEVNRALVQGFQESLGIRFVEGELTTYEEKLVERLRSEKYATVEWNFLGESPPV